MSSLNCSSSALGSWHRLVDRLLRRFDEAGQREADLAGRRAAARLGVPSVSSLVNTAYRRTESSADGRIRVLAAQTADAWTA